MIGDKTIKNQTRDLEEALNRNTRALREHSEYMERLAKTLNKNINAIGDMMNIIYEAKTETNENVNKLTEVAIELVKKCKEDISEIEEDSNNPFSTKEILFKKFL